MAQHNQEDQQIKITLVSQFQSLNINTEISKSIGELILYIMTDHQLWATLHF